MAKAKATETRTIVMEVLRLLQDSTQKENVVIRNVLKKYDYMDSRDKAFIKRLTEGCIEQQILLDYVINTYSNTKTNKMKPIILIALRMGAYQILKMDSVPDSAACNESVNLVVSKGLTGLRGFVNGVLRSISRNKNTIPWPDETNQVKYLSVIYSMPEWIVTRFLSRFGEAETELILKGIQETPRLTVKIGEQFSENECKQLAMRWEKAGLEPCQHSYDSRAYILKHVEGMERVAGFLEGNINVQDASSILAVKMAGIKQGDYIIDVCAAPGGKSLLAASLTGNKGHVEARDLTESKVQLIEENITRLKVENITVKVLDAREQDTTMYNKADVVIADLPCSGLGVMGRKVDIRYHCNENTIHELANLQREILTIVQQYVKPGGIILYSTCTISEEENEKNVAWFIEKFPFHLVPLQGITHELPRNETIAKGYLQMLPGIHECDGFFFAKFQKKMEELS